LLRLWKRYIYVIPASHSSCVTQVWQLHFVFVVVVTFPNLQQLNVHHLMIQIQVMLMNGFSLFSWFSISSYCPSNKVPYWNIHAFWCGKFWVYFIYRHLLLRSFFFRFSTGIWIEERMTTVLNLGKDETLIWSEKEMSHYSVIVCTEPTSLFVFGWLWLSLNPNCNWLRIE
jgi:hypothetical protein